MSSGQQARAGAVAAALFLFIVTFGLGPFGQPASAAPAVSSNPATPAAYILVDADTGNVLAANNDRAAMPPASITKLLTALVADAKIPDDEKVRVGPKAAGMPAMRIGTQAGEEWTKKDLMHSLLMVSANDAAVALAEASAGDLAGFSKLRVEAAQQLQLPDKFDLNDPAGLDDTEFSNDGGDRISARDMAVVARAALASPNIREIIAKKRYEFVGPDGVKHVLNNHNQLLKRYDGAIGMKTGYTKKARHTFVGAAQRDGRTMVAVVMGADSPYNYTTKLLDQGFSTPVAGQSNADQLKLTTYTGVPTEQSMPAVAGTMGAGDTKIKYALGAAIVALVSGAAYLRRRSTTPVGVDHQDTPEYL